MTSKQRLLTQSSANPNTTSPKTKPCTNQSTQPNVKTKHSRNAYCSTIHSRNLYKSIPIWKIRRGKLRSVQTVRILRPRWSLKIILCATTRGIGKLLISRKQFCCSTNYSRKQLCCSRNYSSSTFLFFKNSLN
jgi:hypothetical protein